MKALAPSKNSRTDRIIILGSTGSIGVNTIEVVNHLNRIGSRRFEIIGLAAGSRLDDLAAQATALGVMHVAGEDPPSGDDHLYLARMSNVFYSPRRVAPPSPTPASPSYHP